VRHITPSLEKLSIQQRKEVLAGIDTYLDKKYILQKYFNDPKYKNNPKQLIADAYGMNSQKLRGEISMEIDGGNFMFYVHNKEDYELIYAYGDEVLAKKAPSSSGGYASAYSVIPELR
jgi:hypothetical protein